MSKKLNKRKDSPEDKRVRIKESYENQVSITIQFSQPNIQKSKYDEQLQLQDLEKVAYTQAQSLENLIRHEQQFEGSKNSEYLRKQLAESEQREQKLKLHIEELTKNFDIFIADNNKDLDRETYKFQDLQKKFQVMNDEYQKKLASQQKIVQDLQEQNLQLRTLFSKSEIGQASSLNPQKRSQAERIKEMFDLKDIKQASICWKRHGYCLLDQDVLSSFNFLRQVVIYKDLELEEATQKKNPSTSLKNGKQKDFMKTIKEKQEEIDILRDTLLGDGKTKEEIDILRDTLLGDGKTKEAQLEIIELKHQIQLRDQDILELLNEFELVKQQLDESVESITKKEQELQNSKEQLQRFYMQQYQDTNIEFPVKVIIEKDEKISELELMVQSLNIQIQSLTIDFQNFQDLKKENQFIKDKLQQEEKAHNKTLAIVTSKHAANDQICRAMKQELSHYLMRLRKTEQQVQEITRDKEMLQQELKEEYERKQKALSTLKDVQDKDEEYQLELERTQGMLDLKENKLKAITLQNKNQDQQLKELKEQLENYQISYQRETNQIKTDYEEQLQKQHLELRTQQEKLIEFTTENSKLKMESQKNAQEIENLKNLTQDYEVVKREHSKLKEEFQTKKKQQQSQILQLEEQLQTAKTQHSNVLEELTKTKTELKELMKVKETLSSKLKQSQDDLNTKIKQFEVEQKLLKISQKEKENLIQHLNKELLAIQTMNQQINSELTQSKEIESQIIKEKTELKKENEKIIKQLQENVKEKIKVENKVSEFKEHFQQQEIQLQDLEQQKQYVENEIDKVSQFKDSQISQLKAQATRLESFISQYQKKENVLQSEIQQLHALISDKEQLNLKLREELTKLQIDFKRYQKEGEHKISNLQSENQNLLIKLEELRLASQQILMDTSCSGDKIKQVLEVESIRLQNLSQSNKSLHTKLQQQKQTIDVLYDQIQNIYEEWLKYNQGNSTFDINELNQTYDINEDQDQIKIRQIKNYIHRIVQETKLQVEKQRKIKKQEEINVQSQKIYKPNDENVIQEARRLIDQINQILGNQENIPESKIDQCCYIILQLVQDRIQLLTDNMQLRKREIDLQFGSSLNHSSEWQVQKWKESNEQIANIRMEQIEQTKHLQQLINEKVSEISQLKQVIHDVNCKNAEMQKSANWSQQKVRKQEEQQQQLEKEYELLKESRNELEQNVQQMFKELEILCNELNRKFGFNIQHPLSMNLSFFTSQLISHIQQKISHNKDYDYKERFANLKQIELENELMQLKKEKEHYEQLAGDFGGSLQQMALELEKEKEQSFLLKEEMIVKNKTQPYLRQIEEIERLHKLIQDYRLTLDQMSQQNIELHAKLLNLDELEYSSSSSKKKMELLEKRKKALKDIQTCVKSNKPIDPSLREYILNISNELNLLEI